MKSSRKKLDFGKRGIIDEDGSGSYGKVQLHDPGTPLQKL
jgi:hypothetical protein